MTDAILALLICGGVPFFCRRVRKYCRKLLGTPCIPVV